MKKTNLAILITAVLLFLLITPVGVFAQDPTPPAGNTISGDQIVIANTYRLAAGDELVGNLAVIGGTATLAEGSSMTGDVFLTGGTLTIGGTVNGDIIAIGGAVNVDDTAVINGNISLIGATLKKSPIAKINGEITEQSPKFFDFDFSSPEGLNLPFVVKQTPLTKLLRISLQALAVAALAVVLGLLFPQQVKRVAHSATSEPMVTLGIGALSVVIMIVVLALLSITLILIPVAVLGVLLIGLTLLYGWIAVSYEVGQRLASLFKAVWHPSIASGIGGLLLGLVTGLCTFIPCIGWVIGFLVAILGLGAVVISRFGSSKYAEKMAAAVLPTASTTPNPPESSQPGN